MFCFFVTHPKLSLQIYLTMKGEYGKDGCYTSFLLSVALAVTPQNLFLAVYFSYLKAHSNLMASISHVINLMKASCCHGDVSRRWRRRRRSRWRRMRKTELLWRSMRHDHQLIAWNSSSSSASPIVLSAVVLRRDHIHDCVS